MGRAEHAVGLRAAAAGAAAIRRTGSQTPTVNRPE